MDFDFSDILKKYESVAAEADRIFATVRERCPDEVTCKVGCSDCCNAIFDLSLVEAYYLNKKFNEVYSGVERDRIMQRADEAERRQHKLVRKEVKKRREGEDLQDEEILENLGKKRIRCPLLQDDETCALYDHRPITCRLYGIPTAVEGQARSCGLSGFEPGKSYPVANLEKFQDILVALSRQMGERINTKYPGLATLHVPVSVAIMNIYDGEYLGEGKDKAGETGSDADG